MINYLGVTVSFINTKTERMEVMKIGRSLNCQRKVYIAIPLLLLGVVK